MTSRLEDITGYRSGQRVLSASIANARRLGVTLRLGTDLDDRALTEALRSRPNHWAATATNYPTHEVASGPVCENVVKPPEVNLLDFPIPRWHEGDGGRYAGTGCAVFTTDPDTGVVNAGAYRMQVQNDGRAASVNMEAGKHGAAHVRAWFDRAGRAPVTASLGHDPLLLVVAGTEVLRGVSELEYAGAVLGRSVDVVAGEVTGLPVPAFSEYLPRDNPIQLGAPPGKPPHDYSYMRSVMKSAMIHDALIATGLPGLEGVWAHEAGGGRQLLAVAVHQQYPGHVRQTGLLTASLPAAAYMNKFVVVDHDVDPRSLNDVMWAVCTRTDPDADIEVLHRTWGSRVDPLREPGVPAFNN